MKASSGNPGLAPGLIQILVENHRHFRAFLERRVGNAADAEEILQAAFLKSVERSHTVREHESVVAWFYRLLRNALVDHYRHRRAENEALARLAGWSLHAVEPEPAVEQAICRCVLELLPTIRTEYANVIRRIDLEDASITDVAAETGMTANHVRVRLHRARRALLRQLRASCGTCTEHGCLDCTCHRSPHHPR